MEPLCENDPELYATLLSKQARLYTKWSGAKRISEPREAEQLREQTILLYEQCLQLLDQAEQAEGVGMLRRDTLKKKQASFLNNLAYQLNTAGRFAEALPVINRCLDLKQQGYADRDSLAASYGEKALTLAALGKFQEALRFDTLAREEIKRCADAGDTMSQEEHWIYQVNQGRLLLLLGRVDEAEPLLREAEPRIHPRRRVVFQAMAKEALTEIKQGREACSPGPYQLDWRWVKRYRALSAYDSYWWWAYAGPFTDEEQQTWTRLFAPGIDEATKDQLRAILMRSRDREVTAALSGPARTTTALSCY